MKPLTVVGLVACAVALGAQVVGRGVLLDGLHAQSELIDANLAAALCRPLHVRLAEIVLAAHVVVAASAHQWLRSRWGTPIALVLVGLSGMQRFVVLPAMYQAWSRADLVAARPFDQVLLGEHMQWRDSLLVATMAVLQLVLLVLAARMMHTPSRGEAQVGAPALRSQSSHASSQAPGHA